MLKRWGALESAWHQKPTSRALARIRCLTPYSQSPMPVLEHRCTRFVCVFESEQTANTVYQAYLQQNEELMHDVPHTYMIRLTLVTNCEWGITRQKTYRSAAVMERAVLERQLHIFGFKSELVVEQVGEQLNQITCMTCILCTGAAVCT